MTLSELVEDIMDIAREQSYDDAKLIIEDRIQKDLLRPIHADAQHSDAPERDAGTE